MKRLPTSERVQRLIAALLPARPASIYLFGSAARGDADEFSDLDVVVLVESDQPFLERLLQFGRLLPAEVGAVDLLVYTPDEFRQMREDGNALVEMIVDEGQLLYARPQG